MAEKILIITEKPSAFRAFEKAFGGQSGTFEGDDYALISLFGHIMSLGKPNEVALEPYKERVGMFSNLDGIPWNPAWFDFNKKTVTASAGNDGVRILRDIKGYLKNGYIPVIASDIDPSGEGDLLVWEVIDAVGYTGKVYREYHVDEFPEPLRKAIRERKVVTKEDKLYKMASARSNMDYLTQQLTRVATMTIQSKGYKLPAVVPMGRLQSMILVIVGDQLIAINNYKPSSVFESRYALDNLILSGTDMPTYKTKDEWQADGLPYESSVREVKQVRGKTIPPKSLTLNQLAGIMSSKGMKTKQFMDTYQKMYEGGYMTYPRTEDDFITPEQFNDITPMVDTILSLLSLPSAAFTHREARNTHVKTGGSHGAIRPGKVIPKDLAELETKFGRFAPEIYRVAGERFLMMYLEDTEWVKYHYETTDTDKPFTGVVKIITRQGVTDPDETDDDIATALPDLNKKATLYPHELKSRKPHAVTPKWVLNELERLGVGTPATQVTTIARLSGNSDKFPLKETKTLSLSPIGVVGYQAAQGTMIGSVDGTKQIMKLAEDVKNGGSYIDSYNAFTEIIKNDVGVIRNMSIDLDSVGIPKEQPKVTVNGVWNGTEVVFNRVYMGHEFSDDEVATLLAGEEITFDAMSKDGRPVKLSGGLANQEYKGRPFVGFKGVFVREGYVDGVWEGRQVNFKGSFMDHVFTPDELETLLSGGTIDIETHKDGKTYYASGKLANKTYQGKPFVGFDAQFTDPNAITGVWNGQNVSFKNSFMDHVFTQDEINTLLSGGTINIETHKDDKTYKVSGKLANKVYQGRQFVGFDADFGAREGYATGVWNGKNVSFKQTFMEHTFTDNEVAELLAGKKITFQGKSKAGKEMSVSGSLKEKTYQGRKFVGFDADFGKK